MTQDKIAEYTFPIGLLRGGFLNITRCFDNIMIYMAYARTRRYRGLGTQEEIMEAAGKELGLYISNVKDAHDRAQALYTRYRNTPVTTIPLTMMQDYYKNHKDEFQLACLLAYAAIASMLQGRPWCKTIKKEIHARMCGYEDAAMIVSDTMLSDVERRFRKRYQMDKILRELEDNWGLKIFSYQTQGIYIGFGQTTMDELALVNMQNKYCPKDNSLQMAKAAALEWAQKVVFTDMPAATKQQLNDRQAATDKQAVDNRSAGEQQASDRQTAGQQQADSNPKMTKTEVIATVCGR